MLNNMSFISNMFTVGFQMLKEKPLSNEIDKARKELNAATTIADIDVASVNSVIELAKEYMAQNPQNTLKYDLQYIEERLAKLQTK